MTRRAPIFESVVVAGARTAMAEINTHFRDLSEIDLGSIAAREALRRSGADPAGIDHVVFGNAMQTSANAMYGARHVALKAGLPDSVPALTLNRLCGSGIQSVVTAASLIGLEEAAVVLAGGMENMTQAPHVVRGLRSGLRMGHARLEDALLVGLLDGHCGYSMAQTAENLAQERGITRAEADRYAL
ncbi:MAG: acetyl-CoA C-acyltransferase, partial [Acidobacteriota bacterium]